MDANAYLNPIGPAWMDENGYWRIRIRGKDCYLHRVIYEQAHGPTLPGFHIHHIDEDPSNCSLSNQLALSAGAHARLHHLGTHPSHIVQSDGTIAKRCVICGNFFPLPKTVAYRTRAGTPARRPYCQACYYWTYGWGKWRFTA